MPANPRGASVRLQKIAGDGQQRHDFREGRQPAYADPVRRPENSVLLKPPASESREEIGHRSVQSLHGGLGLAPGAGADEVVRARDARRRAVKARQKAGRGRRGGPSLTAESGR